jgi:hypothetical protein
MTTEATTHRTAGQPSVGGQLAEQIREAVLEGTNGLAYRPQLALRSEQVSPGRPKLIARVRRALRRVDDLDTGLRADRHSPLTGQEAHGLPHGVRRRPELRSQLAVARQLGPHRVHAGVDVRPQQRRNVNTAPLFRVRPGVPVHGRSVHLP